MRAPLLPPYERILWRGYASWADHALLFVFMGFAVLRAAFAFQSGDWETAVLHTLALGVFLGIAAWFHYGAFYQISSQRIRITSGLWAPHSRELPLSRVGSITIRRELLNRWFDLGSLEITPVDEQAPVIIKGVPDPERLKRELDRLKHTI